MTSQETINAARMGLSPSEGDCREIMIRTVYAEAFGEGDVGMEAVAWVIRNRTEKGGFGGNLVGEVCLKASQFEPWRSASGLARIEGLEKGSENYNRVAAIVDRVRESDKSADITGGSDHFGNETIVRERNDGNLNGWMKKFRDQGKAFNLGRHTFYGGDPAKARELISQRGEENDFKLTSDPGALYYTKKDDQGNSSLLYLSEETKNKEDQGILAQMIEGINSIGGMLMMFLVAAFAGISGKQEEPAPVAENNTPPEPKQTPEPEPASNHEAAKIAAAQVTIPNDCKISKGVCIAPEGSQPAPNTLPWVPPSLHIR